jgi:prepilin-type N-terminal cleavage/methylation domain-containing protein
MHTTAPRRAPGRAAFTLVEILSVIGIIGVLASVLHPVFARGREKSRQAACLSHQRQLGAATLQYVQDYDGTWPITRPVIDGENASPTTAWPASDTFPTPSPATRSVWHNALEPYVTDWAVWACPSGEDWNWFEEDEADLGRARFSYALNAYMNVYPDAEVARPEATAVLIEMPKERRVRKYAPVFPAPYQAARLLAGLDLCDDSAVPYRFCRNTDTVWYLGNGGYYGPTSGTYWVHGRGTNHTYADGHTKWVPYPSAGPAGAVFRVLDGRGAATVLNAVNYNGSPSNYWVLPLGPGEK